MADGSHSFEQDLANFDNQLFVRGAPRAIQLLWYVVSALLFQSSMFPLTSLKPAILRVFGAAIGDRVVIKPKVSIKYPWRLKVGNDCWLGESVWIDNLAEVRIGNNVCISQGAMLLTGSHDYRSSAFGLRVRPIELGDGVWICAQSVVTQGVTVGRSCVLSVGSVATDNLQPNMIYQGNPATIKRSRFKQ